jgi:hypothetical protein
MALTADGTSISGYYASSTVDRQGTAACPFSVPSTAIYYVWVHEWAQNPSTDSMFIDLDNDGLPANCGGGTDDCCLTSANNTCVDIYDMNESLQPCNGTSTCNSDTAPYGQWNWVRLNDRSATCGSCTGVGTQRVFAKAGVSLAAGAHTMTFRAREVAGGISGRLDEVAMSSNPNFDPNIIGQPTPTPGPDLCKRAFLCKNKVVWQYQPCNRPPMPPCKP